MYAVANTLKTARPASRANTKRTSENTSQHVGTWDPPRVASDRQAVAADGQAASTADPRCSIAPGGRACVQSERREPDMG